MNEPIEPMPLQDGLLEGDMIGVRLVKPGMGRSAKSNLFFKWPNGRIPYVISNDFNQNERAIIASAVQEYKTKSCIQFVPKEDKDVNFVHLLKGKGCSSHVGNLQHKGQALTLGKSWA